MLCKFLLNSTSVFKSGIPLGAIFNSYPGPYSRKYSLSGMSSDICLSQITDVKYVQYLDVFD